MKIDIRNSDGNYLFSTEVDLKDRPTKVFNPDNSGQAVFLQWEQALDDRKRPRRCLVCGCHDMYRDQKVPPLTIFVIVILAAVIVMWLVHMPTRYVLLAVGLFLGLLIGDVLIRTLSKPSMTCYQCGSIYRGVALPRGVSPWQPNVAEQYRVRPNIQVEESVDVDKKALSDQTIDIRDGNPSESNTKQRSH